MAAIDRLQQLANPMGAVAQATDIAGAQERLSALREQRQYNAQDRERDLQAMDQKTRRAAMDYGAKASMALDSVADPAEKAAMYKQWLKLGKIQGLPLSHMPAEYDQDADRLLKLAQSAVSQTGQGMFAPMPAFDAQGNPVFVQGSRSGGLQRVDGFRPYAPTVAEKTDAAVDEFNRKQGIKGATEPTIAANTRAAENAVDLQTKPAITAAETTARKDAEAKAERDSNIVKTIASEQEVGRILDLAEPLLEKATASLAGAGVDAAGRLIGVSNEGSRAASQLKTLEGALVMKMPRMEGPQSNLDQQLYRQMAAQIGDPTIPADQRKAAMDTLRMLNSRYTGQQPTKPAPQQPGAPAPGGYQQGQIIELGGKRYRITGGDPNDPDVEEVQ